MYNKKETFSLITESLSRAFLNIDKKFAFLKEVDENDLFEYVKLKAVVKSPINEKVNSFLEKKLPENKLNIIKEYYDDVPLSNKFDSGEIDGEENFDDEFPAADDERNYNKLDDAPPEYWAAYNPNTGDLKRATLTEECDETKFQNELSKLEEKGYEINAFKDLNEMNKWRKNLK